jgi:putative tryptophan/tyrosine transport system substrate-binding protein
MSNRREFVAGLGSAVAWSLASSAEQRVASVIAALFGAIVFPLNARPQRTDRTRRIGLLVGASADDPATQVGVAIFVQGLQEAGWVIGRNVQVDTRYGAGDDERLRAMAAELLARSPDLIVAIGSVRALRATNRTTPVVFVGVVDPVGSGYVASLSHPGGNYTGFTAYEYSTAGKWLQLLKQIAPNVTRVAVIRDPAITAGIGQFAAIQALASLLGVELTPIDLREPAALERGIDAFARGPNEGLIVTGSLLANLQRKRIIALAAERKMPAVYYNRSFAADGGLISYGPDPSAYRLAAGYSNRILKGEKPADLPVQEPTKYETVINLKTAKALGLTVPETLLATADELIQ